MQNNLLSIDSASFYSEENLKILLRFKTVFETSDISIQICDPNGNTTLVNQAWRNLWQISVDLPIESIMSKYNVLHSPFIKENGLLPIIQRAYLGEVVETPVIRAFFEEGPTSFKEKMIQAVIYPIRDYCGKVNEIIIVQKDVTDQRLASEKYNFMGKVASILLESLDYNTTLEQVALSTIPFLADGCVVDMLEGDGIKRLVSKHCDPKLEKELLELQEKCPPKLNSTEPTVNVIKSGKPEIRSHLDYRELALHITDPEHLKLVEKTQLKSHMAVPIKRLGETIGAINFGITSDRRPFNENDLKIAMEVAAHAALAIDNARLYRDARNAVQQREDFISMASHELKTPITNLSLKLKVLMTSARTEKHEDFVKHLDNITQSTQQQLDRLTRSIDNMLDVTRINEGLSRKMIEVNISNLSKEVIDQLKEQFSSRSISVFADIIEDYFIFADPYRIEQVIANLLTNAIRYGENKPISLKLYSLENKIHLEISDEGIGIDKADFERIFERYERVQKATEGHGLGLGLFITKQIVHEHCGEISLVSEIGKGSTFKVKFNSCKASVN